MLSKQILILLWPVILLHLGISGSAQAFDASRFKPAKAKVASKAALANGDVYIAIELLAHYVKSKPKDRKTAYQLAELYLKARDYQNAESMFSKLADEGYNTPLVYLKLGEIQMQQQKYAEAKVNLLKYKNQTLAQDSVADMTVVNAAVEGCERYKEIIDIDDRATFMHHLKNGINKAHAEFSPLAVNDSSFIFTALRIDSLQYFDIRENYKSVAGRKIYEGVYDLGEWSFIGKYEVPGIDPNDNIGHVALSPTGLRLYYTVCLRDRQASTKCEIYVSSRSKNGSWRQGRRIKELNMDGYTATQPAIGLSSNGNEVLYFVSDRPGGQGGLDIWYSEYYKSRRKYTEPEPLGEGVNTVADEITPFYDNTTKTLYFSSEAYPGLGGYDIFKTLGELKGWSRVKNMGAPYNTSYDDFCFSLSQSKTFGFLVSNRDTAQDIKGAHTGDDIFHFRRAKYINVVCKGKVYDLADNSVLELLNRKFQLGLDLNSENEYLPDLPVRLLLEEKDEEGGESEEVLLMVDTTNKDGQYYFELEANKDYIVSVKNYGYFDKKYQFNTDSLKNWDTINIPDISINYIPDKPLVFQVLYDYGKANLKEESKVAIDTTLVDVLKVLPNIIVEIGAHTDNKGSEEMNLELSQKRAEAVVDYLIQKGIEPERLQAKGYGFSNPVAPNSNPDGTDNPEGRAKNRRSEIKIVGTLNNIFKE